MRLVGSIMRSVLLVAIVLALLAFVAACSSADSGSTTNGTGDTTAPSDSTDPAVALIETKCSVCHPTDRVWDAQKTRDQWVTTLDRMKTNGLVVTDAEYNQILDYLSNQ